MEINTFIKNYLNDRPYENLGNDNLKIQKFKKQLRDLVKQWKTEKILTWELREKIVKSGILFCDPYQCNNSSASIAALSAWREYLDILLDNLLGIDVYEGEQAILERQQGQEQSSKIGTVRWSIPYKHTGYQTPYLDLFSILDYINLTSAKRIVDIGSGYGRLAFIISGLYREVQFFGYEIVKERVQMAKHIAQNLHLDNIFFFENDVSDTSQPMEKADYYYLYDSVNAKTFDIITEWIEKNCPDAMIIMHEVNEQINTAQAMKNQNLVLQNTICLRGSINKIHFFTFC